MSPACTWAVRVACLFACLHGAQAASASKDKSVPQPQVQQRTEALVQQLGQAWLRREWQDYRTRFVSGGRVVDNGNHDISHSEGQGYAMLLATVVKDRAAFDAIWAWTEAHLFVRPDGLASWKWDPEKQAATDRNNATDGDLLIAWALARAARTFGEPAYAARAKSIAEAIGRTLVAKTEAGPVLLPGASGFGPADQPDGPVLNLSYYVFPAFDSLKAVAPDVDWDGLKLTGYRLIEASRFGPLRLPSDWISLAGGQSEARRQFPEDLRLRCDPDSAVSRLGRVARSREGPVCRSLEPESGHGAVRHRCDKRCGRSAARRRRVQARGGAFGLPRAQGPAAARADPTPR